MWMMGYNDGGDFNSIQDSFNGRKLRTLVPRPAAAAAATNPPCLNRIHGADFLALNHHFAMSSEQNKRELSTQQVVVSSRWNPTPEQLQTLEDLYRRGTRTPSAEQIQHITSQLRRYGKIEGKNVFYWFQNHKARERQKRRRQLESPSNLELPDINIQNSDKKESQGVNRTVFEGEQTKNWASLTKSSTNTEKTSTKGSAKVTEAECKTDGWLQFDDNIGAELQERRTLAERNATWQLMNLSCSSSSSSSLSPTNLLNSFSSSSSSSATAAITVTTAAIPPSTLFNINTALLMQQNIIHSQDFNIFPRDLISPSAACTGGGGEAQTTLQLFPLGSRHHDNNVECDCEKDDEEELSGGPAMDAANATPFQFFEFLPLKN